MTLGFLPSVRTFEPLVVFQIYMGLLVFSPSIYVIKPLGAAGTPATIFGVLLLVLWLVGRTTSLRSPLGLTPMHWLIAAFVVAMLIGFSAGMLRPTNVIEFSSSLRALITLASGVGVILFAIDTMVTPEQITAFLNSIVAVGTVLAVMGLVQFTTGFDFVQVLQLPGLTQNSDYGGLYERSGFARVSGTAVHSIEFAFVVGAVLPLAGHLAVHSSRAQWWKWLPFLLMLVSLPLTVARSGAVAMLIGLIFVGAIATGKQRWALLIAAVVAALVFRAVLPGLLGTIRSLIFGAAEDNSITGRLEDVRAVTSFVAESPWVGRGFGTFVPELYRTLDNQFLATAIETGLIGIAALLALFLGGIISAIVAAWNAGDDHFQRNRGLALAAGLFATCVLSFTFDSFGFPMAFGIQCLMFGAVGAFWRFQRSGSPGSADDRLPLARLSRRWTAIVVAAVLAVLAVGGLATRTARPSFEATGTIVFLAPPDGPNKFDDKIDIPGVSELMGVIMASPNVRARLAEDSVADYAVAVGDGSLGPRTDVIGSGELMRIAARSASAEDALRDAGVVRRELGDQLDLIQNGRGIPSALKVRLDGSLANIEVYQRPVRIPAAAAGTVGVALICAAGLITAGRRLPGWRLRRAASSEGVVDQRARH